MTLNEAIDHLINKAHIEDYIYNVRENAVKPLGWKGTSWELPEVVAYSDAIAVLKKELDDKRTSRSRHNPKV